MRVALHLVGRQADALEQRGDALACAPSLRADAVDEQRLGDEVADAHARIERGVGVLEDHLHVAAHRLALARGRARAGCARRSRCRRCRARGRRAPWRWSTCRSRIRRPAPASRSAAIEKLTPSTAWTRRSTRPKKPPCRSKRTCRSRTAATGGRLVASAAACESPAVPRRRRCAAPRPAARACSRPAGAAKMSAAPALLDHAAVAHDDDAVGHLGDHAHVVGDQDDGRAELALQVAQQFQHLPCTVTSSAVVGSSAISTSGLQRQRHGDHHALAHAAGQLVRILLQPALGLGDAHRLQRLDGALRAPRARDSAVCASIASISCRADRQHRVERGHRLLEDHGDAVAADAPHRGFRRARRARRRRAGSSRRRCAPPAAAGAA